MAEAILPLELLSSAMGMLAVKESADGRSSNISEPAAGRSKSELSPVTGQPIFQVKIQWKHVLLDAVQELGVSHTAYSREETMDDMFQVGVNFSIPLNKDKTKFRDIVVTGGRCLTLAEAESEASALALQEVQHGYLNTRVLDVSRMRFKEMRKMCEETLANASETYHIAKSLLSDWENTMDKVELCYSPNRHTAFGNACHNAYKPHGYMSLDVANHLAGLVTAYYEKLKNLAFETEMLKTNINKAGEHVNYFFSEPSFQQDNGYQGSMTGEVKIRMSLVLQEMTTSLGWARPSFNIARSVTGSYVCETSLFPSMDAACKILSINGSEAACKEEAIENSCKAAILALETKNCIYLLDLNYNDRVQGKFNVMQTKEVACSASSICSKILVEWEAIVKEIRACKACCQKLAEEHPEEEQGTSLWKIKWTNAKAVSGLLQNCVTDFLIAKNRVENATGFAKRNEEAFN